MIDLYRINLNLLVALDVLLSEQSVTKAAHKLHMTQAAMSNNLQQLRDIFKDELLVREKNSMIITSYAASLQTSLHQLLEEMQSLIISGQRFIPAVSQRVFKLGLSDYMSSLLMPQLIKVLEDKAPGVKIIIISPDRVKVAELFEHEECDLVISKFFKSHHNIQKQLLFQDRPVCVLNKQHPLARKKIVTLKDYLGYQHVAMRCHDLTIPMFVDEALSNLGVERNVKVYTSFMSNIFQFVSESQQLLGTVSEKASALYQKHYDFGIKQLPFIEKELGFYLCWHQRYQDDLGHAWLREQLIKIVF